ncbi:MAG: hypothetical protein AAFO93_08870 [Pseudomonadota bacterium]
MQPTSPRRDTETRARDPKTAPAAAPKPVERPPQTPARTPQSAAFTFKDWAAL